MHTERRWCEETQGEGSHLQGKEKKPQKKAALPTPWSWTSKPAPCEEINICCLSRSVCGTCYGSPSKLIHQEIRAKEPISCPRSQRWSQSQDENPAGETPEPTQQKDPLLNQEVSSRLPLSFRNTIFILQKQCAVLATGISSKENSTDFTHVLFINGDVSLMMSCATLTPHRKIQILF